MTISTIENSTWSKIVLVLFLLCGIIVCIPIFSMDYLITLDGPNHLYTSGTFYKVLGGDDFYSSYFQINHRFTPNYFTVFVLGGLQSIFGGAVALKTFHLLHIILLLFSSYFWSNSSKDKWRKLPFLILPFVYSYLFFSGFYNFIFATSLSMLTIGFFDRFQEIQWKSRHYFLIGLLLLVVYISHIVPFFFVGLYFTADLIVSWKAQKWSKIYLKHPLKLLAYSSPGIILTFLFMSGKNTSYEYLEFNELIARITSGFSISIKNETDEDIVWINWIKLIYLGIALMLFIYSILQKSKKMYSLGIATGLTLILYFILPDSAGFASVFSVRIEYIFWIFVIIGATRIQFEKQFIQLFPAVLGLSMLIFQINSNLPHWRLLNGHAKSILTATTFIDDGSIVYPVFNSLYWDDYHISNLMGTTNKKILVLENTSARQDYFPIIYNSSYEDCLKSTKQRDFTCENQSMQLDYLLIVGKFVLDPSDTIATNLYAEAYKNGEVVFEDDLVQLLKFN